MQLSCPINGDIVDSKESKCDVRELWECEKNLPEVPECPMKMGK